MMMSTYCFLEEKVNTNPVCISVTPEVAVSGVPTSAKAVTSYRLEAGSVFVRGSNRHPEYVLELTGVISHIIDVRSNCWFGSTVKHRNMHMADVGL